MLPALVTAIVYLSNCLWMDRPEENKAIIKILQLILKPSQKLSPESSDMLNSVKNIVAKPLENGLRTYQRQNPKSQDVEPLLEVIKENIGLSRRTGAAGDKELGTWSNGSGIGGGLVANIKHTVNSLAMWSMHQPVIPTAYTHRLILVGLKVLGAKRVLNAILEELKQQTEAATGSVSYGYDVAVSLVCAPDVTNVTYNANNSAQSLLDDGTGQVQPAPRQLRLSLRDVLRWAAEDWKKVQKKDPVMAEIIVRLYQRVEKQMQPAALAMPGSLDPAAGIIADALAVDDATAAAMGADPMSLDSAAVAGLPLDLGGGAGDLGLGGAGDLGLGDGGAGSGGGLDDWGSLGLDWDASMDLS